MMIPVVHSERPALVSAEDYDNLSKFNWMLKRDGYVWRSRGDGRRYISMHRQIMSPGEHELIDHINRDKLDNTRGNLRVCNHQQSSMNRGSKGVTWHKKLHKWQAYIGIDGGYTYLGIYKKHSDAVAARTKAAESIFGAFAPNITQDAHLCDSCVRYKNDCQVWANGIVINACNEYKAEP